MSRPCSSTRRASDSRTTSCWIRLFCAPPHDPRRRASEPLSSLRPGRRSGPDRRHRRRHRRGAPSRLEVVRKRGGYVLDAVLGYEHGVFEADAAYPLEIETRLDSNDISFDQCIRAAAQPRLLVNLEADAM